MEVRHGLVALITLNIFISYADRANLSVIITELEKDPSLAHTTDHKGLIFGIFYLGYEFSLSISGTLSDKYGPRWILLSACLVWSIAEVITIFAVRNIL